MRHRSLSATLLSCAALLAPLGLSAAPAYGADPTAPHAELTPDSGQVVPGGDALAMDATFHNTLDTDITDSFVVAVGVRLAPPAARLTPEQVTVEWFDAGPSVWRPVRLTPGETALSGYLSTDAGLPSVGSLPAGDAARVSLRVRLASGVPSPATLQFVAQGLLQPTASADPVTLMDGKASYSVDAGAASPTPVAGATPVTGGAPDGASGPPSAPAGGTPATTPAEPPSSVPPSSAPPAASGLSDGTGGGGLTDTTTAVIAAAGVAVLVFAAAVAVGVTRRRHRGRP
ncbi:hypothetical protein [Streptomyces sp. 1222.5]|uniref:hypothetical protein n=1 Tax=Streptomyces sp. 1222.5 TaxID=1881026 RepID=UPI003EB719B8